MIALKMLVFLWMCHSVLLQGSKPKENSGVFLPSLTVSTGISKQMILTKEFQSQKSDFPTTSYPTEEKSVALTVAASSVIIFIAILVVIVIILVSMVSIKFKCHHCKKVTDKQKPQHPIVSYSCSDADTTVGKKNVLLVSMKDLSATSSKSLVKLLHPDIH
ncbi:endothelial cell-specific chemotaxis regulator isoform X2 [Python bivittatus]|uniref:Endothelial cell-specific chemotaxis regulator isoform X2 n=1 Tax=Python bivittatus TaxID=176946 RepID=A0A9F5J179_PYTBI|nr:endothelial cell-specific chemotaxis regulator isoform X2 [Python bivittatus]